MLILFLVPEGEHDGHLGGGERVEYGVLYSRRSLLGGELGDTIFSSFADQKGIVI